MGPRREDAGTTTTPLALQAPVIVLWRLSGKVSGGREMGKSPGARQQTRETEGHARRQARWPSLYIIPCPLPIDRAQISDGLPPDPAEPLLGTRGPDVTAPRGREPRTAPDIYNALGCARPNTPISGVRLRAA